MKKLLIGMSMLVLLAAGACTKPVDDSILNAPPGTVVDETQDRADRRPPPATSCAICSCATGESSHRWPSSPVR